MPDVLHFDEKVPTPGFAPGTTAVRSGVCIVYYTLWAIQAGGRDGCCPRYLLPDKEASLLILFTTEIGCRGRNCTGVAGL